MVLPSLMIVIVVLYESTALCDWTTMKRVMLKLFFRGKKRFDILTYGLRCVGRTKVNRASHQHVKRLEQS